MYMHIFTKKMYMHIRTFQHSASCSSTTNDAESRVRERLDLAGGRGFWLVERGMKKSTDGRVFDRLMPS